MPQPHVHPLNPMPTPHVHPLNPMPTPEPTRPIMNPIPTTDGPDTSPVRPIMNPVMPREVPLTAGNEKLIKSAAKALLKDRAALEKAKIEALPVGERFARVVLAQTPSGPDRGGSTTALIPEGPMSFGGPSPNPNGAKIFYIQKDEITIAGLLRETYGPFPVALKSAK